MGGYGSTRWNGETTRWSTAELPGLDVRHLHRSGQVTHGAAGLEVMLDGAAHPTRVRVAWTPCRCGGARPWLVCSSCGHRRARLYLHDGCWLDCRACLNLTYATTRWSVHDRRLEVLYRIHRQLGGTGGVFDVPLRPKGMHRATYERLWRAFHDARIALWGGVLRADDDRLRRAGWIAPAWSDGLNSPAEFAEFKPSHEPTNRPRTERATEKVRGVAGGSAGGRG